MERLTLNQANVTGGFWFAPQMFVFSQTLKTATAFTLTGSSKISQTRTDETFSRAAINPLIHSSSTQPSVRALLLFIQSSVHRFIQPWHHVRCVSLGSAADGGRAGGTCNPFISDLWLRSGSPSPPRRRRASQTLQLLRVETEASSEPPSTSHTPAAAAALRRNLPLAI